MHALIIVDLQRDFLPGGALAVPKGDEVIPVANDRIREFSLVVATQDWHPPDHGSFASNHEGTRPGDVIELEGLKQVLWPVHCVQGSSGAAFADGLNTEAFDKVIRKGTNRLVDSYSGFFDNGRRGDTGLADFLTDRQVASVHILGLATDYCVKYTALDAASLGFETHVIRDGIRGVDLHPGDSQAACDAMAAAGVLGLT
ncbi:MAG: bifunctional nicotinamidase/pyrazinamidase [Planctomycetota bacterium]|jgi:nicotinamidase/pyrazinamidase